MSSGNVVRTGTNRGRSLVLRRRRRRHLGRHRHRRHHGRRRRHRRRRGRPSVSLCGRARTTTDGARARKEIKSGRVTNCESSNLCLSENEPDPHG